MKYEDLYERGVKHLEGDLLDVLDVLNFGENVCLCSPNMGDTRLIDYVAFKLQHDFQQSVLYDKTGELTVGALRQEIQAAKNEFILLIPHYVRKSKSFHEYFQQIMSYKAAPVRSVIAMEYDFLKDPSKYFRSGRAISYVKIRKPLTFDLTQSVIDSRRMLNDWGVPKKFEREIHQLSGGIIGLIKHICGYVDKFGSPDPSEMLYYPPIVRVLDDMKRAVEMLSEVQLKKLGYIKGTGEVRSVLLEQYLRDERGIDSYDLPPTLLEVFSLLLERKGEVVSIDEIHERVSEREEFSLWAIYKMVSRLRQTISEEYEIHNVKGEGYILRKKGYASIDL